MSDKGGDTRTVRRALIAIVVAAAVAVGAGIYTLRSEGPVGAPWDDFAPGWTLLPPPPEWRFGAGIVWTGDRLLYWGGASTSGGQSRPSQGGFAFDPARNVWAALPDAPEAGSPAASIWTGSEALFFLPNPAGVRTLAFDPSTDTWRTFDVGPPGPSLTSSWTWTGHSVVVFGGAVDRSQGSAKAWWFDPSGPGSWSHLPPAPIAMSAPVAAWDGQQLVVAGWSGDLLNAQTATLQVQAFNLVRPAWSILPPTGLDPVPAGLVAVDGRTILWQPSSSRSLEWVGASDSWQQIQMAGIEPHDCPVDTAAIAGWGFGWNCGSPAAWSAASSSWSAVQRPDATDATSLARAVGVDQGFVVEDRETRQGSTTKPYTQSYLWFWKPPAA